ncbi:DUF5305 family protein [Thermococcus sp.]
MMKRKISRFFRKKEVLGAFLFLFIVFGLYSLKLMSAQPYVVSTRNLGTFTARGTLTHEATFKNNTLYGDSVAMENYPMPIVEELKMVYTYESHPGLSEGNYTLLVTATYYVSKGTQEIVLWKENLFEDEGVLKDGAFTSEYTFDVADLDNRSSEIARELGIKRLKRKITITATVNCKGTVGSREISESFTQTSQLIRDPSAELYYFVDTTKKESKPFTETSTARANTSVFGISSDVKTAQTTTTILALLMLVPLIGYAYLGRGPKDDMKKLRPYIVRGAPGKVEKKVHLRTQEDLEKTFELLDKPIMNYIDGEEEVYVIIDNGVAYEYRKPLPGAKRTAN